MPLIYYFKKIRFLVFCTLLLCPLPDYAQYSVLLTENFNGCGQGNLNNCGWSINNAVGSPWRISGGACSINGTFCLQVGSDGVDCQYNILSTGTDKIAYKSFVSNGYQLLDISFDWKCMGELNNDYGQLMYSFDAITWSQVTATMYQLQAGTQNVVNLALPNITWNLSQVFIGFRWVDDVDGIFSYPGFIVDDVLIRGEQIVPDDPPNPTTTSAGCDSAVLKWNGIPPSPSNVVWYWQNTSCGTSLAFGSAQTMTVFSSGTYYIRAYNSVSGSWSIGCGSISVTVDSPAPVSDAGASASECDKDFIFSAVPTVGTGTWSQMFGSGLGSFANSNDPNTTVTVTQYGDYVFEWTEKNGACVDSDSLIVSFYEMPVPNSGNDMQTCGLSIFLNAVPSVGTGTWSLSAGPGIATFINPSFSNTSVTVDAYGTYDFSWTETNGTCIASDIVTVNFYEVPTPVAGTDANVCDTIYTLNATPSVGTGTWSKVFGPGTATFSNVNDPNATVSVSQYGSYLFEWEEVIGLCNASSFVTVNFYEPPLSDAGPDDTVCASSYQLGAVPVLGSGNWTQVAGPGTASFSNSINPLAIVTVDSMGTYDFEWRMNNNGCIASDTVRIIFTAPPSPFAGPDGNECDFDHIMAAVPTIGTGTWTFVFGPGSVTFINVNDPADSVTVSAYGTYIFRWTEDNGLCAASDDVSVNFSLQPNSDAGIPDTACGLSYSLNAFPSFGAGQWSQVSGPGTSIFSNPSFNATVTVSTFGSYVFQWKETNMTCSDSDGVQIDFFAPPTPSAGADASACGNQFSLTGSSSGGTVVWTQVFGAGVATFAMLTNPFSDVQVNQFGSYVFRLTETNSGCTAFDDIAITFYQVPGADAGPSGSVCETLANLSAIASVGIGNWSVSLSPPPPGTASFGNVANPLSSVTVSQYGTYIFAWTEINGICTSTDTTTIIFYRQPIADAGNGGKECDLTFVCSAVPSVGTGTWSMINGNGTPAYSNPNASNAVITVTNTGPYIFQWREVNGICSSTDEIIVNFYPQPVVFAGNDTSVSLGDLAYLNGKGGEGDVFLWSPDSTLSSGNISNPTADPIQDQIYTLIVTTVFGCADTDDVKITVMKDFDLNPTAVITPNGDGYNDKWYVDNIEFYSNCEVILYNRYGNVVYQKKGYLDDFDGKYNGTSLPDGTYYYVIKCSDSPKTWSGNVTIVK